MNLYAFDENKNKVDISNYATESEWTNLIADNTTVTDDAGNKVKISYLRVRKIGKIVEVNGFASVTLAKASGKFDGLNICRLPTQFKPYSQCDFDHTDFDIDSITIWRKIRIDNTGISLSAYGMNTAQNYGVNFPIREFYTVK